MNVFKNCWFDKDPDLYLLYLSWYFASDGWAGLSVIYLCLSSLKPFCHIVNEINSWSNINITDDDGNLSEDVHVCIFVFVKQWNI